ERAREDEGLTSERGALLFPADGLLGLGHEARRLEQRVEGFDIVWLVEVAEDLLGHDLPDPVDLEQLLYRGGAHFLDGLEPTRQRAGDGTADFRDPQAVQHAREVATTGGADALYELRGGTLGEYFEPRD